MNCLEKRMKDNLLINKSVAADILRTGSSKMPFSLLAFRVGAIVRMPHHWCDHLNRRIEHRQPATIIHIMNGPNWHYAHVILLYNCPLNRFTGISYAPSNSPMPHSARLQCRLHRSIWYTRMYASVCTSIGWYASTKSSTWSFSECALIQLCGGQMRVSFANLIHSLQVTFVK